MNKKPSLVYEILFIFIRVLNYCTRVSFAKLVQMISFSLLLALGTLINIMFSEMRGFRVGEKKKKKKARIAGNPKPDGIPRHFAIDRLRRGCVEPPLATAPLFYALSRELRKLRRAETAGPTRNFATARYIIPCDWMVVDRFVPDCRKSFREKNVSMRWKFVTSAYASLHSTFNAKSGHHNGF